MARLADRYPEMTTVQVSEKFQEEVRSPDLDYSSMSIEELGGQILEPRSLWVTSQPAVAELERRIIEAQTAPPTDKKRFVDEIGKVSDQGGLRVQVGGYDGLGRLGYRKEHNSIYIGIPGVGGCRAFNTAKIKVVPTTHNLRRQQDLSWAETPLNIADPA